jgi:hypothetical protein
VLKNINSYVIDKYYDEICIEIYNGFGITYEGTHSFLILQDILKYVSSIDKYVDVPVSALEWICDFVESNQDYDKLSKYGDFYYKIKTLLR